jgi:hypothetical protein
MTAKARISPFARRRMEEKPQIDAFVRRECSGIARMPLPAPIYPAKVIGQRVGGGSCGLATPCRALPLPERYVNRYWEL